MIRSIPYLTLSLVLTCIGIHLWVPDKTLLYFSASNIFAGDWWRLITGHLTHADNEHLLWNCIGLFVLGALLESRSRRILTAAVVGGITAVDLLLLSPLSSLDYYCGLSGALNALLAVAIWKEWERSHSISIVLVGGACVAKALVETWLGSSLLTSISWQPYAISHIAGLVGGIVCVGIWHQATRTRLDTNPQQEDGDPLGV